MAGRDCGAFIGDPLRIVGPQAGVLSGRTVAVKDIFDVAGHPTGFGNPTWLQTHPIPTTNARAVQALLDAGATVVGKTHLDELAYSLNGENFHFGTPRNPAAPSRLPGGSSSGSAVAVAAGLADVGLGTDTGGSVRVPASYCGVLGIRPTHGRVSLDGARPLAPSYDTAGWFTRDASLLRAVGDLLLDPSTRSTNSLSRMLVATDLFDLASQQTTQALYDALAPHISVVKDLLGSPQDIKVGTGLEADNLDDLDSWFDVFRITQAAEIWREHGEWVTTNQPQFGPGVKERFQMAASITAEEDSKQTAQRRRIREHMDQLLAGNAVLVLPSAPGPSPLLGTPPEQLDQWRRNIIALTGLAGMSGLPQVNLPIASVDGAPVGLGLVGPRGSDEHLLMLTEALMASLSPPET